ncbi:hypothetical protein [Paracidovorax wautersii]|uniref:hypothetical protein n=1 Tax=Paracidovorax wautersii TaxID=1177982 RepID=UPI0031D58F7D
MPHPDHLSPRQRAAQVLDVTARAWGLAIVLATAPQRRVAPPSRAASRAVAACLGLAAASPSRLRLSAHGFDISY